MVFSLSYYLRFSNTEIPSLADIVISYILTALQKDANTILLRLKQESGVSAICTRLQAKYHFSIVALCARSLHATVTSWRSPFHGASPHKQPVAVHPNH